MVFRRFENNQYSCNSESRDYYFSNHGLDDVMKANGNSKSIKSGSKIELNNYICEISKIKLN
jgi:hypothetical protein